MADYDANLFRRLLGHNLPKFFLIPGKIVLGRIAKKLSSKIGGINLTGISNQAEVLRDLFDHYELFLQAVLGSYRFREDLVREPNVFNIKKDIIPRIKRIFSFWVEMMPGPAIRRNTRLKINCPASLDLLGHKEFLMEILMNLLMNSVSALKPQTVENNPDKGIIKIRISNPYVFNGKYFVKIQVLDKGPGFSFKALRKLQSVIRRLDQADRDTFWLSLQLLLSQASAESKEEHLGIGLIFCVAYLRSLEWQESIGVKGRITVTSKLGAGSTVSVTLPYSKHILISKAS